MKNPTGDQICSKIDEIADDLWETSVFLHEHPETAYKETQACEMLSRSISRYGFSVKKSVGGIDTAFLAERNGSSPGPKVAFLAEYDALPEIGHACGHNLIAGASLGAAAALGAMSGEIPGSVLLIGTPAEEGGGGKLRLIEGGVFRDVNFALMFHPGVKNLICRTTLARRTISVEFRGVRAHSKESWKGVDALQAVLELFRMIDGFRTTLKDRTLIHGCITDGGKVAGINDRAAAHFSVRARTMQDLETAMERIRLAVSSAEMVTGASAISFEGDTLKERLPNRSMALRFREKMQMLGENVLFPDVYEPAGSSDAGNLSQELPLIHPYIRITDQPISAHTEEFAAAARSERGREVLILAAKGLALTGYDLLTDMEFRLQVERDFKERVPCCSMGASVQKGESF